MVRQGVFAVLAAVGLASAAAAGECPIKASLAGGIRADYADGAWAKFRPEGLGLVRITESPDPATGRSFSILSRWGLYDLDAVEIRGDAAAPLLRVSTDFVPPAGAIPAPEPGTVWSGRASRQQSDGAMGTFDAIYVFNTLTEADLDGCKYPAITVRAAFIAPDGWLAQEYLYFPSLGFAAIIASQTDREDAPKVLTLTKLSDAAP